MSIMNLKETELCLGLPGGIDAAVVKVTGGKRGFSETEVELQLNLEVVSKNNVCVGDLTKDKMMIMMMKSTNTHSSNIKENNLLKNDTTPPAKAQVVGWPPVRSYRKNMMSQKTTSTAEVAADKSGGNSAANGGAAFVKVSMDGAPYLRKVDLKMYKTYQELSDALAKMFSIYGNSSYGAQGMIDFMNERKLMDLLNSSEYVPTYEDKDGDWMLVGDVPWEMFVDSCKRLRIMKGSEAIGLAPRAMEKCKSRS